MCSSYWTVSDSFICPACGEESDWEIQTHQFGEVGSCVNVYALGDRPKELEGVKPENFGLSSPHLDYALIESAWCPKCSQQCNAAIAVRDGVIIEVGLAPI